MVMQRWDPFGEMSSLRQAMDRLLEDSYVRMPATGRGSAGGFDLDVIEQNGNIVVRASLPGVKPEDVNISVEKGVLTIDGETRDEQERGEGRYYHRERRFGRFTRQITLPTDVNADACDASFEHGVLTITLPRAEHARPRQIPIRGRSRGQQVIEGTRTDGPGTARDRGTGTAALSSAQSKGTAEGSRDKGSVGTSTRNEATAAEGDKSERRQR